MASEPTVDSSHTTISATERSEGPKRTTIETAKAAFVIGEASPLEHLLGSLAACLDAVGHLVAEERDVGLRDLDATVDVERV